MKEYDGCPLLFIHNQGWTRFNGTESWSEMLIDLPRSLYQDKAATDKQKSQILAILYVMETLKNQSKPDQNILPYRTYIWEGAAEDPATPELEYKAGWCFKYGEEEWMARKEFGKIKTLATGTAIKAGTGRVNCVTGASL